MNNKLKRKKTNSHKCLEYYQKKKKKKVIFIFLFDLFQVVDDRDYF